MRVEIDQLVKRYGAHFELNVPSLEIEEGALFGLVGNNGAGKTTFLRLLLDLVYADEGLVRVGGREIAGRDDWKVDVGSYLDESFLLDFLTADEYLDFVGATYGMTREDVQAALDPYRPLFTDQVLGSRTRYIRDFSLGNRKKVGIVAAMVMRPRLLILDEPFANLDPGSQRRLLKMIRDLNQEAGTTAIISSHDIGHVVEICDRIAVLEEGRIVRDLRTSEETLPELKSYFDRERVAPGPMETGTTGEVASDAAEQDGAQPAGTRNTASAA